MTKANPDYAASAVNLTNSTEVRLIHAHLRELWEKAAALKQQAEDCIPEELRKEIAALNAEIAAEDKGLRGYIDTFGSFQNPEFGWYAVKQRRESTSYTVEACRKAIPQYASAVIEEYVNEKKVEGLLKGGLITKEDVAYFAVKTPLAPAYIIR